MHDIKNILLCADLYVIILINGVVDAVAPSTVLSYVIFILYSLALYSVHPVTNLTSDTSSSVYILYVI